MHCVKTRLMLSANQNAELQCKINSANLEVQIMKWPEVVAWGMMGMATCKQLVTTKICALMLWIFLL